ncbi:MULTISPECIES: hypothetical protein [unclassified Streptomyces]|uniref:hypothetical protein n=1 Tax=unclassified Streptomyces TaxID=2593676 RepID=UPI0008DE4711|nr:MULTISPECIES: hypothetical protein [unclassified Streptomyces]OII63353.1 hypothetical protein BJP39_10175 [Streptomyces sp. CC77]
MHGSRQFHTDIDGHSITVSLGAGRSGSAELLVDGKVIGYVRERTSRTTLLDGELAEDPVRPFTVHVRQPALGLGAPECTVEIGGERVPMPERRTPRAHRD